MPYLFPIRLSHLPCRLLATIVQTASSLEKATGIPGGNAKHKPLPLETSLWTLKRLLPFIRTIIHAKQTILHPIHQLPVELLTEIFICVHNSNVDSSNHLLLRRPHSGCLTLRLSTPLILGSVSAYWRNITHTIPTLLCSLTPTKSRLPLWWRKSLTSDAIGRRGIDFFFYDRNTDPQLSSTIHDIKVTWIRSLTVKGCYYVEWKGLLERGPFSRLEELNVSLGDATSAHFDVPRHLSKTLRTLTTYECVPIFQCALPKLRKLSVIYTESNPFRNVYGQRDRGTLATFAPNLEELCLLNQSSFPYIYELSTTAEDIELDWITIRNLASLSPGLVKMPAKRMATSAAGWKLNWLAR